MRPLIIVCGCGKVRKFGEWITPNRVPRKCRSVKQTASGKRKVTLPIRKALKRRSSISFATVKLGRLRTQHQLHCGHKRIVL